MGKKSKRAGRASRDVHATIRGDAEKLKRLPGVGVHHSDEYPKLAELLHAGREAVAAGVPRFFLFEGRNYWLRVRLAVHLDVFAEPGDAVPLVSGLSMSQDDHGHVPGH